MQNTPPIENLLSTQKEIRAKQDELGNKERLGILDDKLEMSETCCFEEYLKGRDEKNFISRVFGIFAEDLIELWIRHNDKYKFYGDKRLRPSLYNKKGLYLKTTLDFVLEEVSTKKNFIVEMKSEMAYKNFQNVSLNEKNLQSKMKNDSFKRFVELAKDPLKYIVKVEDKKIRR